MAWLIKAQWFVNKVNNGISLVSACNYRVGCLENQGKTRAIDEYASLVSV